MDAGPDQDTERQEALRLKTLAEAKFNNSNFKSAVKYAKKAHRIAPNLDGLSSMVTSFKILRAAAKLGPGTTPDWYKILQVEPFSHINTIKKQYKKLALVLHPDKNPYLGSEEAFKLVGEGFGVLSDRIRRKEYDMRLRIRLQAERLGGLGAEETFWTACSRCRLLHQFVRKYLGHNLVCPTCKMSFEAVEVEEGDGQNGKEDTFRSERLRNLGLKRKMGSVERLSGMDLKGKVVSGERRGSVGLRRKMGGGETIGGGEKSEALKGKRSSTEGGSGNLERGGGGDGEWDGGRLRSGGLRRRMSTVGEVLERSKPWRVNFEEETMTLAEMQSEAKRKAVQDKVKLKGKENNDEVEKKNQKRRASRKSGDLENEGQRPLKKSRGLEILGRGSLKESGNLEIERHGASKRIVDLEIETQRAEKKSGNLRNERRGASKKSVGLEIERRGDSDGGNLEIMAVEDSDFYDFDKDRVERSFKKGQVWAIYDDDDGMPRHYGLIDEVVSVNPFEVKMSWLDLQNNGDEGLINLEKMGFHVSCGRFKVAKKTSINSVNIFSHVVECERAAREVYRIYPKKGSVWALYNEAALRAEGRSLSAGDKRCYNIVVFFTTYSEMHGLSMAYLEKVDGFKTIFKRHEIGCHAIRWLEKDDVQLFSHQIPSRKLSRDEVPETLKDCWELDPASLPSDLLTNGWG